MSTFMCLLSWQCYLHSIIYLFIHLCCCEHIEYTFIITQIRTHVSLLIHLMMRRCSGPGLVINSCLDRQTNILQMLQFPHIHQLLYFDACDGCKRKKIVPAVFELLLWAQFWKCNYCIHPLWFNSQQGKLCPPYIRVAQLGTLTL